MDDWKALQNEINGIEEPVKKSSISLGGLFDEDELKVVQQNNISSRIPLEEVRLTLTDIVDSIYKREEQLKFQEYMGVERKLPANVFNRAKSFFIPDPDYFLEVFKDIIRYPEYGLITEHGLPIYIGRYVYPVLGFNSEVLGLIGYDKFENIKYLLSRTVGFGKLNMFYGMQDMRWIYKKGYIIVVEGIVDQILLRLLGEPAIALCGNAMSEFVISILRRFGKKVLFMPDNNETGERALGFWLSKIPDASVLRVASGDDFDKWRQENDFNTYKPMISQIKRNLELGIIKEYQI